MLPVKRERGFCQENALGEDLYRNLEGLIYPGTTAERLAKNCFQSAVSLGSSNRKKEGKGNLSNTTSPPVPPKVVFVKIYFEVRKKKNGVFFGGKGRGGEKKKETVLGGTSESLRGRKERERSKEQKRL